MRSCRPFLQHSSSLRIFIKIPKKTKNDFFSRHNLQNRYNRYALIFFSCEILNFTIVVGQFFITNSFLRGQFKDYGIRVWEYYQVKSPPITFSNIGEITVGVLFQLPEEETAHAHMVNPMCEVFPRVVSCTYFRFGSGGRQTSVSALCILALNIVIDKIYLVLWFW